QIPNVEGSQPMFGSEGEIFFRAVEGNSGYAYLVREDGTGLRKAVDQPVLQLEGVSPDARWLVLWSPLPGANEAVTQAFRLDGGPPVSIPCCTAGAGADAVALKWSSDGRFLLASPGMFGGALQSYLIPLPAGQMLPEIPAGGLTELPGARAI